MTIIVKDPGDVSDFLFDDWDSDIGSDTIDSHTVTADTGLTVDSSSASSYDITAWLSGGTAGNTYRVTCEIVTAAGRTLQQSMCVRVMQL